MELHPHGNVTIPGFGMDADVPGDNYCRQVVVNN